MTKVCPCSEIGPDAHLCTFPLTIFLLNIVAYGPGFNNSGPPRGAQPPYECVIGSQGRLHFPNDAVERIGVIRGAANGAIGACRGSRGAGRGAIGAISGAPPNP